MIIENSKIYIDRSIATLAVDANINIRCIMNEITYWLTNNPLMNSMTSTFSSDILYILDHDPATTNIEDMSRTKSKVITIGDTSNIVDILDNLYDSKIVVIGAIQNIPLQIMNELIGVLVNRMHKYVILFGDELVDSAEDGNYHRRYLTNCNFMLRTEDNDDKIGPIKKVNNAIQQMRKPIDINALTSSSIHLDIVKNLDVSIIDEIIEENKDNDSFQIVVPRRLYFTIMSDLYRLKYPGDNVLISILRQYWLRNPLIIKDNYDDSNLKNFVVNRTDCIILSPMTKIVILKIDEQTNLFKIKVIGGLYEGLVVSNLKLDYVSYLWNFDPDRLVNDDFFVADEYSGGFGATTELHIVPFPIRLPEACKTGQIDDTHAFIETTETFDIYRPATDLFQIFNQTKKGIYIYQSDIFNYI